MDEVKRISGNRRRENSRRSTLIHSGMSSEEQEEWIHREMMRHRGKKFRRSSLIGGSSAAYFKTKKQIWAQQKHRHNFLMKSDTRVTIDDAVLRVRQIRDENFDSINFTKFDKGVLTKWTEDVEAIVYDYVPDGLVGNDPLERITRKLIWLGTSYPCLAELGAEMNALMQEWDILGVYDDLSDYSSPSDFEDSDVDTDENSSTTSTPPKAKPRLADMSDDQMEKYFSLVDIVQGSEEYTELRRKNTARRISHRIREAFLTRKMAKEDWSKLNVTQKAKMPEKSQDDNPIVHEKPSEQGIQVVEEQWSESPDRIPVKETSAAVKRTSSSHIAQGMSQAQRQGHADRSSNSLLSRRSLADARGGINGAFPNPRRKRLLSLAAKPHDSNWDGTNEVARRISQERLQATEGNEAETDYASSVSDVGHNCEADPQDFLTSLEMESGNLDDEEMVASTTLEQNLQSPPDTIQTGGAMSKIACSQILTASNRDLSLKEDTLPQENGAGTPRKAEISTGDGLEHPANDVYHATSGPASMTIEDEEAHEHFSAGENSTEVNNGKKLHQAKVEGDVENSTGTQGEVLKPQATDIGSPASKKKNIASDNEIRLHRMRRKQQQTSSTKAMDNEEHSIHAVAEEADTIKSNAKALISSVVSGPTSAQTKQEQCQSSLNNDENTAANFAFPKEEKISPNKFGKSSNLSSKQVRAISGATPKDHILSSTSHPALNSEEQQSCMADSTPQMEEQQAYIADSTPQMEEQHSYIADSTPQMEEQTKEESLYLNSYAVESQDNGSNLECYPTSDERDDAVNRNVFIDSYAINRLDRATPIDTSTFGIPLEESSEKEVEEDENTTASTGAIVDEDCGPSSAMKLPQRIKISVSYQQDVGLDMSLLRELESESSSKKLNQHMTGNKHAINRLVQQHPCPWNEKDQALKREKNEKEAKRAYSQRSLNSLAYIASGKVPIWRPGDSHTRPKKVANQQLPRVPRPSIPHAKDVDFEELSRMGLRAPTTTSGRQHIDWNTSAPMRTVITSPIKAKVVRKPKSRPAKTHLSSTRKGRRMKPLVQSFAPCRPAPPEDTSVEQQQYRSEDRERLEKMISSCFGLLSIFPEEQFRRNL